MTIGLEGFGLSVLIVYTIFTGLMYCSNKKAADAAKSAADTARTALELDQRPWITVASITLTSPIKDQPIFIKLGVANTAERSSGYCAVYNPKTKEFFQPSECNQRNYAH